MKSLPKPVIVLKALLAGLPVSFVPMGQTQFVYSPRSDGADRLTTSFVDGQLCFEMKKNNGETMQGVHDIPISLFVKYCEQLSDDEVFLLGANTALTKMNKERQA